MLSTSATRELDFKYQDPFPEQSPYGARAHRARGRVVLLLAGEVPKTPARVSSSALDHREM